MRALESTTSRQRYSTSSNATLEVDGFFAKDLKARTHVVVHERLAQRIQPSQDSITQSIHWFCCLSRGKCTLAVAMDKNVYLSGETAKISCHITNDSRVNISALRCHLYQDIILTLAFREAQTFTRLIAEARFSGIPAGKSSSHSQPLRLVPTVEGGVINPLTSGTLVKCAYRIEIDCDIPWCPDVTLHLPLTIIAPALPGIRYITPPTAGYIETRSESM